MLAKSIFFLFLLAAPLFSDTPPPPPAPATTHVEASVTVPHSPDEHSIIGKAKDSSYEHAFIKMVLTLGGLLFLVFFTLWALRKLSHGRMGSFGSQKKIKVLEKKPLSPKTVLYLLDLDGKQVFVAESQLEVSVLLNPHETELD